MPIVVPIHAKINLNSEFIDDEPILLLEVRDSTLGTTVLRYCSKPIQRISVDPLDYGVVSNGNQYIYALTGSIPSDQEGAPLRTQLVIDNIDQEKTQQFVDLTYQNQVDLKVILASDPDTNLRDIPAMFITLVAAALDGLTLTLERNFNVVGAQSNLEPWPSGLQTIVNAPGLHRQ